MSLRILVVDDSPFMRATLVRAITEQGWEVAAEASNGKQAIARYQELRPDVVTMGITMPVMDGLSALKAIMMSDPAARIIMCSAAGLPRNIEAAIAAGAKTFLVKPFRDSDIVQAILAVMELPLAS